MRPIHEIDIVQNPRLSTHYDRRPAGTVLDRSIKQSLDAHVFARYATERSARPRLVRGNEPPARLLSLADVLVEAA